MKKLLFVLSLLTFLTGCGLQDDPAEDGVILDELGMETVQNIEDGDMNGLVSGFVFDAGELDDESDDSIHIAYHIATVTGDILQQLSPWVTTSASEIEISTEEITSQTFTAGVSVSMSATVGVNLGAVAESTFGFTASLEYAITRASSNSVSLTFPLEDYNDEYNYAVFLVGGYNVYQVFSTNLQTGLVDDYYFVKPLDTPVIKIVSSNDISVGNHFDIKDYSIEDFNLSKFKVTLNGDGEENPYEIYSENDLYAIFFEPDANYILMNNIYLENYDGLQGTTFTGSFDGNEKAISGLNIEIDPRRMDNDYNYGFFSIIEGAEIKDLTFSFPTITLRYVKDVTHEGLGYAHLGVLSGSAINSTIDNVDVQYADISNSRFRSYNGGIVGSLHKGSITNSKVFSSTIYGTGTTGGIVGLISGLFDSYATLENCKYYGTQENKAVLHFFGTGDYAALGGIAGYAEYTTLSNLEIKHSYFASNGTFQYTPSIGYIAGHIKNCEIDLDTLIITSSTASKSVSYDGRDSRYFAWHSSKFGSVEN